MHPGVYLLVRYPGAELRVAVGDESKGVLGFVMSTAMGAVVRHVNPITPLHDLMFCLAWSW